MTFPWNKPAMPTDDVERLLSTPGWVDSDRALHCCDCPTLYTAAGEQRCPRCGSRAAWNATNLLRRGAA